MIGTAPCGRGSVAPGDEEPIEKRSARYKISQEQQLAVLLPSLTHELQDLLNKHGEIEAGSRFP